MQIVFYSLSTFNTLYEIWLLNTRYESLHSIRNSNIIRKFCNFLFICYIFPCSMFVAAQFWGVYSINRKLIFPKLMAQLIPAWQNHAVHTLPTLAAIVENFFNPHFYPSSILPIGLIPFSTSIFYTIWSVSSFIQFCFYFYSFLNLFIFFC